MNDRFLLNNQLPQSTRPPPPIILFLILSLAKMPKHKPDKELNRLRHELEHEREKVQDVQKQLQIRDGQLDAAEKLETRFKALELENDNEALKKELASTKDAVRSLKGEAKKAAHDYLRSLRQKEDDYNDDLRRQQEEYNEKLASGVEDAKTLVRLELDVQKNLAKNPKGGGEGDAEEATGTEGGVFMSRAAIEHEQNMQNMLQGAFKYFNNEHKKAEAALAQDITELKTSLAESKKAYKAQTATYDKQLKTQQEEKVAHAKEVAELKASLAESKDMNEAQTENNQELFSMFQELWEKFEEVKKRNEVMRKQLDIIDKSPYKDLFIEVKELKRENAALIRETADLKEENQKYEALKRELDALKASNTEYVKKHQEWRAAMLRVASEDPISTLVTQKEVKESGGEA